MAQPFNKFASFIDQLSKGGHNLQTDVFKVALTNTAPTAATDTAWSAGTYPPPASALGYPAGGGTLTTNSAATTGGTFKLVLNGYVFTASGGQIGPYRYAIIYNSSKSNLVVGYYDYGSSITSNDTETLTVGLDTTNGLFTIA